MSRSGYSDDYEYMELYRQAVRRAITGYRGQAFLRKLLAALDAMPVKRLIVNEIRNGAGDVCALGSLDASVDEYDASSLAEHFGIARALAAEIVYENDEGVMVGRRIETPEERWTRMRAWVESQCAGAVRGAPDSGQDR